MHILITGGKTGFVGKNLVEYLSKNTQYKLFTPMRRDLDLLSSYDMDGEEGAGNPVKSILYYLDKNKIDTIIHLAATVAGLPGNIGNQGLFAYENCQMGLNIFEAARLANVKKIVNLATVCGYHDVGPKPFQEENFWNGLPHESNRGYGMAKRFLVMLGIEYERQYGMNITNLIPINLVGPYDTSNHVVMDLIRKFESPKIPSFEEVPRGFHAQPIVELWGTGNATREFCDVLDLCRAIEISLNKNTGAWPINIGTCKEITIKDLAELINKIGDYNVQIRWQPDKPEGQKSRCLDISRAKEILNWEPTISLEDSILRTIKWYRSTNKVK